MIFENRSAAQRKLELYPMKFQFALQKVQRSAAQRSAAQRKVELTANTSLTNATQWDNRRIIMKHTIQLLVNYKCL